MLANRTETLLLYTHTII